eukprot:SAG31_NODE_1189_length_9480_cov_19.686174_9_plen_500_part_00
MQKRELLVPSRSTYEASKLSLVPQRAPPFLPLCSWRLQYPASIFSLVVANLNETAAATCLVATSHQLLALSYPVVASAVRATQPVKEVLLQLAHPYGELNGLHSRGHEYPSAQGLLARDLRYDHRIVAVDFVQRSYRSPLVILLVSRALRLSAASVAAVGTESIQVTLPPAQFSLHVFGFGCPANASLRILCRNEQVLQLDYAAWTVAQLRPVAGTEVMRGSSLTLVVSSSTGQLYTYEIKSGQTQSGQGGRLQPSRSFLSEVDRVPIAGIRAAVLCIDSITLEGGDVIIALGMADGMLILFHLTGGLPGPTAPICRHHGCNGPIGAVKLCHIVPSTRHQRKISCSSCPTEIGRDMSKRHTTKGESSDTEDRLSGATSTVGNQCWTCDFHPTSVLNLCTQMVPLQNSQDSVVSEHRESGVVADLQSGGIKTTGDAKHNCAQQPSTCIDTIDFLEHQRGACRSSECDSTQSHENQARSTVSQHPAKSKLHLLVGGTNIRL